MPSPGGKKSAATLSQKERVKTGNYKKKMLSRNSL